MTDGFRLLRWRAIAWEMNADINGAKKRLAIRNAEKWIQVYFKIRIEIKARPHPTINKVRHLPKSVPDDFSAGQSNGP